MYLPNMFVILVPNQLTFGAPSCIHLAVLHHVAVDVDQTNCFLQQNRLEIGQKKLSPRPPPHHIMKTHWSKPNTNVYPPK